MLKITTNLEKRFFDIKTKENIDDELIMEGYALKFESPARHKDGLYTTIETIDRQALNDADMKNVPLTFNHNDEGIPLASTKNGSLNLRLDDIGLKIIARLDKNIQQHRDIHTSVRSGLINKMSFAFPSYADTFETRYDNKTLTTYRILKRISVLHDVAVVTNPYYDCTELEARKMKFDSINITLRKTNLLLQQKIKKWRMNNE